MNKGLRLFSAAERSEAVSAAAEFFRCGEDELKTHTISEGTETADWIILAFTDEAIAATLQNMNADFNLVFEPEGVYFELYPAMGEGLEIDPDAVFAYIRRKKLESLNTAPISRILESGFGREKIAPPQDEQILGEELSVSISKNEMEAYVEFLPPDEGGAAVSVGDISETLKSAGVIYGLSGIAVGGAYKEKRYGKQYLVASGTEAAHGEDALIDYHFDSRKKSGLAIEGEKGRVDFRVLDIFEPVKKDQLLVTRTLPTTGTMGHTVTGRELIPRPGRDFPMPKSKNTVINEDSTAMYAAMSGLVSVKGGVITVTDTFVIPGDCDMSVGNIDFEGNVSITGMVITGMRIKATGNITVGGIVYDAEITAGGNIDLKLGIQGADKGKITAGGSVTASFIERAIVKAGQNISADVILHSDIEAGHSLIIDGKRGNIVGGTALAGKDVTAKNLGGVSQTQTNIQVGVLPAKLERLRFLKTELENAEKERRKIEQIEAFIAKPGAQPEEKRRELAKTVLTTKKHIAQLFEKYSAECAALEQEVEDSVSGKVHCTSTAYPGVKIAIGKAQYKVNDQMSYATFKYKEGAIAFTACEV